MLSLRALHPAFGAEVSGVQLIPEDLEPRFPEILDAFHRYGLLLFRDQRLEPEHQISFMARIGEVRKPHGVERTLTGYPQIAVLGNIVENGCPIGFQHDQGLEWHTDGTGWQRTTIATCLYSLEAPASGGGTLFCGGYHNLEVLPEAIERRVEGLNIVYSRPLLIERISRKSNNPRSMSAEERAEFPDVVRPFVSVHPVTGKSLVVLSIEECRELEGMSPDASRALLEEIIEIITAREHVYRHKWRAGDVLLWDNRCMMHSPTHYTYQNEHRRLHRVIGLGAA